MQKKIIKLTEKELKNIVKNITEDIIKGIGFGCISYSNPIGMHLIQEGLMRTYPVDKTVKWLSKYIGYEGQMSNLIKVVKDAQGGDVIQVYVLEDYGNQEILREKINQAMNLCGWNLSYEETSNFQNKTIIIYQFEPKFKEEIVDVKKLGCLYHTSPYKHFDKILKQGLAPRSTNGHFNYPPRIYCFYGNVGKNEIIDTTYDLEIEARKNGKYGDDKYIVYKIYTAKLNDDVKFFKDSTHEYAVFTYDNIPSTAITPLNIIEL